MILVKSGDEMGNHDFEIILFDKLCDIRTSSVVSTVQMCYQKTKKPSCIVTFFYTKLHQQRELVKVCKVPFQLINCVRKQTWILF